MTAPLYDNGSSLWHNQAAAGITKPQSAKSQPFHDTHEEQIRLVDDFSWLNFDDLSGIDDEFNDLLSESPFIDDTRRDALCFALRSRLEALKVFAAAASPVRR